MPPLDTTTGLNDWVTAPAPASAVAPAAAAKGIADWVTSPAAKTASAAPPPLTPDIRGLIDQSRKMGASDDQIRDLMVKAPFLQDTWQASEKAGIPPDAVFQHFGLSAPTPAPQQVDNGPGAFSAPSAPVSTLDLLKAGRLDPDSLAARVGTAAKEGYDSADILTPEGHKAVDDNPILSTAVKVGNAVLGAGNAVASGALAGVASVGDDISPGLGRGLAGMGESAMADAMGRGGGPVDLRAQALETESRLASAKQAETVAAIGKAPDIDSAIAAASKAAAASVQAPNPTPGVVPSTELPPVHTSASAPVSAAPESVGAAATSELDPEVGNLTPEQELAYRSTAEGQKLLEPQPLRSPDNTAYVPGVTPTAVETAQTVEAARELKMLKNLNPDVAEEASNVHAANSDARQRYFEQLAGSDIDVANATAARNAQMDADTQNAWAGKTEAGIQPVLDVADTIMQSRDGRRPLVRNVVQSVLKELYDDKGEPITDPEILYGVGDHINDLLNENDAGGQKKNARASAALMGLKNALYDQVIEPAAPGFKQALDNYRQASIKIDEMTALQKFEPKLYDANNRMTYAKVQSMMRQIVDSRQAPGINPFKSISDDAMAGLWNLRDDLRRTASAENLARTPGSDTAQNMFDAARQTAMGVGSTLLHAIPVVGDAVKRGTDVAQPLLDARAARLRSERGMAILHPETPPIARDDIPPPATPFVPRPVAPRPDPDLFSQPSAEAVVQTQLQREQAAVAAMKARAQQARPEPAAPASPPDQTQLQREQSAVAAMKARAQRQTQYDAGPTAGPPAQAGNLYASTTALTPAGKPVAVRYVVREANDLTPSQLPDGRPNPAFPPELQPRDRTRAASTAQVSKIANELQPERLGYSSDTATGAPVVGPDGLVESGNGRAMAIQRAYAEGSTQAESYRAWLAGQGFNVAGMRAPVLVRERTAPLAMADRAKLADEMGAFPTMGMAAPERAAADAKRIRTDVLSMIQRGDVTSQSNAPFVRAFAAHAVPASEHASFMTADGDLSVEGATRVRNALTQRAYGSNALVTSLAEDADPELKAFGGALVDAAGPMAKLRGAIEAGAMAPSDDIAPALNQAAALIRTARRTRMSLADAVGQTDAFSQIYPRTENLLRAAFGPDLSGRMSRARLTGLLSNFSDKMQQQSGLLGDNRTADQILEELVRKQ